MARKTASQDTPQGAAEGLGEAVVDSAQKIWLAGLGAFARARSEGDSVFNTLVEQGKGLRERARGAADEALKTVRTQADATLGQFDKLEQVFEDRVSRSLNRLGVLTTREVDELSRQVQELNESVQSLMRTQAARARKAASPGASPRKAARGAKKAAKGAKKATRKARR